MGAEMRLRRLRNASNRFAEEAQESVAMVQLQQ